MKHKQVDKKIIIELIENIPKKLYSLSHFKEKLLTLLITKLQIILIMKNNNIDDIKSDIPITKIMLSNIATCLFVFINISLQSGVKEINVIDKDTKYESILFIESL